MQEFWINNPKNFNNNKKELLVKQFKLENNHNREYNILYILLALKFNLNLGLRIITISRHSSWLIISTE